MEAVSKVKSAVRLNRSVLPEARISWALLLDCGHSLDIEQERMPRRNDAVWCPLCAAEELIDAT